MRDESYENCEDQGRDHTPIMVSERGGIRFNIVGDALPSQLMRCTTCGHSWACFITADYRNDSAWD